MGRAPSALSMVSVTSARPSGGREVVPAKTTSSILPPRSDLAPCSPMTQARASTMLDLPEPLGPTTQVMPGSRRSEVADANDLKPRRVRVFRYTKPSLLLSPGDGPGPQVAVSPRPYRAAPSNAVNCELLRGQEGRGHRRNRTGSLTVRWHRETGPPAVDCCRMASRTGVRGQDNRDARRGRR